MALQYLDALRQDPETPAALKKTLEFEEGRTLIEEATHSSDPDISKAKLEQAKVKIEAFVKANPDLPQTTEALVDLAHLLYERGLNEVDIAGEARAANDKESKLAAARGYYESARTSYAKAFERLNAKLAEYPKFIPPEDPRKLERERVRNSVMQAELQKSVVDYYEAQTYPQDSKERSELLDKGLADVRGHLQAISQPDRRVHRPDVARASASRSRASSARPPGSTRNCSTTPTPPSCRSRSRWPTSGSS